MRYFLRLLLGIQQCANCGVCAADFGQVITNPVDGHKDYVCHRCYDPTFVATEVAGAEHAIVKKFLRKKRRRR